MRVIIIVTNGFFFALIKIPNPINEVGCFFFFYICLRSFKAKYYVVHMKRHSMQL